MSIDLSTPKALQKWHLANPLAKAISDPKLSLLWYLSKHAPVRTFSSSQGSRTMHGSTFACDLLGLHVTVLYPKVLGR